MPALPLEVDLLEDFQTYCPSRAVLLDRLRQNFSSQHAAKSQHPWPVCVDLPLHVDERPGRIRLRIPVGAPCPRCQGSGRFGYFACAACEGHGMHWTTGVVEVNLTHPPAGPLVVSLAPLQVHNLELQIRLRPA